MPPVPTGASGSPAHGQQRPGAAVDALLTERGRFERALHDLELAMLARPDALDLKAMRARTLLLLGRDLEARAGYLDVLHRDPDHLEALTNLGRNLATHGFRQEARQLFEHAVARYPSDAVSLVNLGTLLYQSEEPAAARQFYESALRAAPGNVQAHAGLSFVLSQLGEDERALHHRRLGFAGRSVVALPYRGTAEPVRVLLLASAYNGNVPIERHLDDRTFQTWIVTPEFHAAGAPLPAHDLVVNAIGDVDAVPQALEAARRLLAGLESPVLNPPERVAATGRCENLARLAQLPGVRAPRARIVTRTALQGADAAATLHALGLEFPLLLRSPGFHTGEHFVRVASPGDLAAVLATLPGEELLAIEFLDVRGTDGQVRKYRVMMVGGELLPLHLAVSRDWKVHYFTAGMADHPEHRAEEARFLEDMAGVLGNRGIRALQAIQERLGLDYGGVDFALDAQGSVVVFEANATMAVFAPDADARWDYRRPAVARVEAAVRQLLLERARAPSAFVPGTVAAAIERPALHAAQHAAPHSTLDPNELNFSAGPGALPRIVLEQAQQAILALPETGLSVLGMSHRSAWFEALLEEAERNLRELLSIPDSHAVLFLQGGSSLQFSMIPMNFARPGDPAPQHVRSGYWSAKAIEEARCVRPLDLAWDGAPGGYRRLPEANAFADSEVTGLPYLHYVSNETVEGLQFAQPPRVAAVPLVADMSSDFLSRPIDFRRHAMIYAHAQKNLGPAGVTVCVIDRSLLERVPAGLPPMLDYRTHLRHRSNYNTPPVFGIYTMTLVTRWVRDGVGGLEAMTRSNTAKSQCLYAALDRLGDRVEVHAGREFRSAMNASFRFKDPHLDARFLEEAAQAGFSGLAGHRALGGIRASLYNAVSGRAVAALAGFIEDFARRNC